MCRESIGYSESLDNVLPDSETVSSKTFVFSECFIVNKIKCLFMYRQMKIRIPGLLTHRTRARLKQTLASCIGLNASFRCILIIHYVPLTASKVARSAADFT